MTHSFEERAQNEFLDQLSFYRQQGGQKVAARFSRHITQKIEQLKNFPKSSAISDRPDERKAVLLDFPFAVIYRYDENNSHIEIIAVADTRRKPDYWKGRK